MLEELEKALRHHQRTRLVYAVVSFLLVLRWATSPAWLPPLTEAEPQDEAATMFAIMAGAAVWAGAVALYFRFTRIARLLSDLNPEEVIKSARALRFLAIITWSLSAAVGEMGFALFYLYRSLPIASVFFMAGITLFIICYPRTPAWASREAP